MNIEQRLFISYYKELAPINEKHGIFLVQHIESKKIFVKKVLTIYNAEVYEYLRQHPIQGLPRIYACCEEDSRLTVIEEYISGETLEELLNKDGPMDIPTACHYVSQLCNIVSQLHQCNPAIIHRDIKPSNLMITPSGQMFLLDFNAAKYYKASGNSDTVLLGTHGFAAPEQYGFGESCIQTDIYALGILLQKLTEGYFVSLDPNLELFQSIVETCTRLNVSERYPSVEELNSDLKKIVGETEQIHTVIVERPMAPIMEPTAEETKLSVQDEHHWYLLPGFRKKNPFYMATATLGYVIISWLSFTLEVNGTSSIGLVLNRIFCFFMFFLPVLFCSNYMDVQRFVPFCKDQRLWIRIPAIAVCSVIIAFCVLFVLTIVCQPFTV